MNEPAWSGLATPYTPGTSQFPALANAQPQTVFANLSGAIGPRTDYSFSAFKAALGFSVADISGLTVAGNNIITSLDAITQRSFLGLGNSSTRNVGTAAGTVAAGDDSRIIGLTDAGNLTTGTLALARLPTIPYTQTSGITPAAISALALTGGSVANVAGSAFTFGSGEQFVAKVTNASDTGNSIYTRIFPGTTNADALQGVTKLLSGSNIGQTTAVSGYFRNQAAVSGINNNAVALFGAGTLEANSSAGWGVNTLLQDAATRTAGTATGIIMIGHEADFNVMNPATQVIGFSAGGNSLAQSTNAVAFIANSLGTGYKWTTGLLTIDGAATYGISLGKLATSGSSNNSQPILFQYSDAGGVARNVSMNAQVDFLVMSGTGGSFGLKISAGNLLLDSGKGVVINGQTVLSNRKTGWSLPTGVVSRASFTADYTQTIGGSYSQAQVQAIQNTLTECRQILGGLITDLYGLGPIGA